MPSRCAYSFMSCTKPARVPPTRCDSATVASLPDCTIIPLIRSMTGTSLPTLTKVREPPVRQAASLIVTGSSSFSRPSLSAEKTMYVVSSLVRLAGSIRSSAFFWAITSPLWLSMRVYEPASRSGGGGVGTAAAATVASARVESVSRAAEERNILGNPRELREAGGQIVRSCVRVEVRTSHGRVAGMDLRSDQAGAGVAQGGET